MITKGIIEEITSYNTAKVRIPIMNKISSAVDATPTEDLCEASFSVISGFSPNYKVGEVVFVGFEDNEIAHPIILGTLYRDNMLSAGEATLLNVDITNKLTVANTARLPEDTMIGKVGAASISALFGVKGNIQQQIDTLSGKVITVDDVDDHLSSTSENPVQNKVVTEALNKRVSTDSIAASGEYDLIDDEHIPTTQWVYDAIPSNYVIRSGASDIIYGRRNGSEATYKVAINNTPSIDYNTLATTLWVNNNFKPCLIEGALILMADMSEIPVENVSQGDVVKSYNPTTGELCDAVVIDVYQTGVTNEFEVYNFSNGKHLPVYGFHGYYSFKDGYTKNIESLTRDDILIDSEASEIRLVRKRKVSTHGEPYRRFNIITSNNLYFANKVLLGRNPTHRYERLLRSPQNIPEDIMSEWKQDCTDYDNYSKHLNDADYYMALKDPYEQLAKSHHIIEVNKKRLQKTDYKSLKYAEGLMTEDEFNEAKKKREIYRKQINDQEVLMKDAQKQITAKITELNNGVTVRGLFEQCCDRDNAIFEKVRAFYNSLNKR